MTYYAAVHCHASRRIASSSTSRLHGPDRETDIHVGRHTIGLLNTYEYVHAHINSTYQDKLYIYIYIYIFIIQTYHARLSGHPSCVVQLLTQRLAANDRRSVCVHTAQHVTTKRMLPLTCVTSNATEQH